MGIEASKKRFNPQQQSTGRILGEFQSRNRRLLVDLSYGECILIGITSVTNTTYYLSPNWPDP